ncbi:MAG: hypothetical protein O7E54_10335, partial [Planctomycetota bacterium]|nr:hypothetical protein [Planctomycetota bacterium]
MRDVVFPVALFGLAFWVAYATRAWIALPYSNPEEVVGPLTFARVNPLDDLLRFVWMLALPFLSLLLAHRWIAARPDPPPPPVPPESRGLPAGVLVLSLLLLVFVCGTFNYD